MKYINKQKLDSINLNKDNFYVVIDFDRTLTAAKSISCWRVLYHSNLLGKNFKQSYDKIHDATYPSENETIQVKHELLQSRFSQYMELLKNLKIDEEIIERCVNKTDLKLRDGAREFLTKMYEYNIPVIIISASIGNVIEKFLKFHNCLYDNIYIYANYLDMTYQGKNVCNITPYSKNRICFSQEITDKIKDKYYILLVGDIIEDINMVSKEHLARTLSVGFLDKEISKNLEKYINTFDIVLADKESFINLLSILEL